MIEISFLFCDNDSKMSVWGTGAMSPATLLMSRRSRDTTYLVLKQIVEDCPYLSMDALKAVFAYTHFDNY